MRPAIDQVDIKGKAILFQSGIYGIIPDDMPEKTALSLSLIHIFCSRCGNMKKDLKLSDRIYRCECGNVIDRDFQAAINLKAYGERFAS